MPTAAEKEASLGAFNAEPSNAPLVVGSGNRAKQSPTDKQAASAAAELASVSTPGTSGYKIGPLDVIEFSVFKAPELARVAQIADTGTVNLPLVGEIQAAGKTAQEIERNSDQETRCQVPAVPTGDHFDQGVQQQKSDD
jgi:polysaccharide biosynthesis/export protein